MAVQNCGSGDYAGKTVPLEFAIACGNIDPSTLTFLRLGALTVKSFEASMETTSTRTDTDAGGYASTLVTGANFSVSGSGKCKKDDPNHLALVQAYFENAAGDGLRLYVRLAFPDLTFRPFCVMSSYSRTGDTTDFVTFDVQFEITESEYNTTMVSLTPSP